MRTTRWASRFHVQTQRYRPLGFVHLEINITGHHLHMLKGRRQSHDSCQPCFTWAIETQWPVSGQGPLTSSPVLGTFVLRTFVTLFNRRSGSHISLCINTRHSERIWILVIKTSIDATAAIHFFDASERKLRDYIMLDFPNVLEHPKLINLVSFLI